MLEPVPVAKSENAVVDTPFHHFVMIQHPAISQRVCELLSNNRVSTQSKQILPAFTGRSNAFSWDGSKSRRGVWLGGSDNHRGIGQARSCATWDGSLVSGMHQ